MVGAGETQVEQGASLRLWARAYSGDSPAESRAREHEAAPGVGERLAGVRERALSALKRDEAADAVLLARLQSDGILSESESVILVLGRYAADMNSNPEDLAPFHAALPPVAWRNGC